MRIFSSLILIPVSFIAIACSTTKTFQPEIGGAGATSSGGSIVYAIPPRRPVLKMKLISAVEEKKNKMLRVRMYFVRTGKAAGEYFDPRDQTLFLPESQVPLYPSQVHGPADAKPLIRLAKADRQVVELLYDVPKGGDQYPYIKLNWKIHFQKNGNDQIETQTARFDFVNKSYSQRTVGQYDGSVEFPFIGEAPLIDPWFPDGWMWW